MKLSTYLLLLTLFVVVVSLSLGHENHVNSTVNQEDQKDKVEVRTSRDVEVVGDDKVDRDNDNDNDDDDAAEAEAEDEDEDEDDVDDDEDEDGDEVNEENGEEVSDEVEDKEVMDAVVEYCKTSNNSEVVSDLFGNKIRLENNRTFIVPLQQRNQARFLGLGLLTIKALVLGPLIGLTIKAALIRGLMWAIGAYLLHLFFPALLSALGLGTGLVGFARSLQPNYAQMILPHLANIPSNLQNSLPTSVNHFVKQYSRVLQPVVESIRSIPEGHCRFRAVCETANYIIRNTQFMSRSLQRISATIYLNFGTEYSKAWLDGIVQSDCSLRYSQCPQSPFSMVASELAEAFRPRPVGGGLAATTTY